MKYIPTITLLFLLTLPASAQDYATDQGAWTLGGGISFTSQGGERFEVDGNRISTVSAKPFVQYFVARGFGIGLSGGYGRASQGNAIESGLFLGPAMAYYFGSADSGSYPFLGLIPFYEYLSFSFAGEDISGSGFGISGEVGGVVLFSPSVALRMAFFYTAGSVNVDEADEAFSGNSIGASLGIQAFIF